MAPQTGLAARAYTATVTVGGENGISQSFDVRFTVTAAPALSDEKNVAAVTSPELAQLNGTTITAMVLSNVDSLPIALSVSEKASWKLFRDAACMNEITSKTMTLSVGGNTHMSR